MTEIVYALFSSPMHEFPNLLPMTTESHFDVNVAATVNGTGTAASAAASAGERRKEADRGGSTSPTTRCNDFRLEVHVRPTDISPLYAISPSTATEAGIKVTILRHWPPNYLPDELVCEKKTADHLFRETPEEKRNMVFLQFCPPGHPFLPYDKEKERIVLTVPAFLSLLRVFRNCNFQRWEQEMDQLKRRVDEAKEMFKISPLLSFSGAGDVVLAGTLQERNHTLVLETTWKYQELERKCLVLSYANLKDSRPANLCVEGLAKVGKEYDRLEELLDYKEGRPRKRARQ